MRIPSEWFKAGDEDKLHKELFPDEMDKNDYPCGCGDYSTCRPDCGENGQKCPDGHCLGQND